MATRVRRQRNFCSLTKTCLASDSALGTTDKSKTTLAEPTYHPRDPPSTAFRDEAEAEDGKEINRYQLAAALIDYDDESLDRPSHRAHQSAILSPFRHILSPTSPPSDHEEAAIEELYEESRRPSSSFGVAARSFPGGSERGTSMDAGRSSFGDDVHRRYSRSHFGIDDEERDDPEEEERLAGGWGLSEIMSQLGSPSGSSGFELVDRVKKGEAAATTAFPQVVAAGDDAGWETRSAPDVAVSHHSRTFSGASTAALDSAPSTRLQILDRTPQSSQRTQSALVLPRFDALPTFDDPTAGLSLSRSPIHRTTSSVSFSGVHSNSSSGLPSRPISRLSQTPSLALDRPTTALSHTSRPLSQISNYANDNLPPRPRSSFSQTPSTFTSRFDPAMLALAREELTKDRPVFARPEAGAPPKLVLMPAPLAGRPPSPVRKPRVEGPEEDSPSEDEDEAVEVEKPSRPAGALYGRSLMDVLDERAAVAKSRQRQFVPGQDGRRSMMDWGRAETGGELRGAAAAEEEVETAIVMKGKLPKSKSTMSVFGPDLLYQKELKRKLELDRIEAEEREAEERKKDSKKELDRLKAEKKKGKRNTLLDRHAAERKLEGRSPSRMGGEVDPTEYEFVGGPPSPQPRAAPPPQRHAHKPSVAPSLSLPAGFDSLTASTPKAWGIAPPSPRSDSSSSSSAHIYAAPAFRSPSPDSIDDDRRHEAHQDAIPTQKSRQESSRREIDWSGNRSFSVPIPSHQYDPRSPPKLNVELSLGGGGLGFERTGLLPSPGANDDSEDSEDDRPLGLRDLSNINDDDVPLGLKVLPGGGPPAPVDDEDDVPLGLALPGVQEHLQRQSMMQAGAWMQYQQQSAMMHQMTTLGAYGPGPAWAPASVSGGSGIAGPPPFMVQPGEEMPGGMVERWRRGVSYDGAGR